MSKTTSRDAALDAYIHAVNRHPLLSREEEFALATNYCASRNPADYQRLITSNLRFVIKLAHQYKGYDLKLMDLIQEGNLGLMMAAQKFEPSRGYRFISYAVWWVRAYMQNYIMKAWSLVKVGTTQAQRKLFFKLKGARERAMRLAQTDEMPSFASLAETLGVAAHEVESMQGRMAARDFSLDAQVHGASSNLTHVDRLEDPSLAPDVEAQVLESQEREVVRAHCERAKEKLNIKERYVLDHRLMSEEPATLQEIGTHFGISRERARQIESNVRRKVQALLQNLHGVHRGVQAA